MPISSTISTLHRSRLHRVLAEIRMRPETFDQRARARATTAGTTYDVAGHAVHLYLPDHQLEWEPDADAVDGEDAAIATCAAAPDGTASPISDLAAKVLGLTADEMAALSIRSHRFVEVEQTLRRLLHPSYTRDFGRPPTPAESH